MKLAVITNAQTPYRGELLEKSARRVGIEILRFAEDQTWPNDYRQGKLVTGLEFMRTLPEDITHVMFVDNSDTLMIGSAEEIVEKFEALRGDADVIIQGEKNCYPDNSLALQYHDHETPWQFVNSGGWIARREDAIRSAEVVASLATYCDQLCWTKAYLYPSCGIKVRIDQNCQIFQSMFMQQPHEFALKDGRMKNLVTGGRPCVLHWNGTKNQGVPYSRDGVWKELSGEPGDVPTIAVCMPGNNFSAEWVFGYADLYLNMVKYFGTVRIVGGWGNNIYQVRENCVLQCAGYADGPPDYVLWIDSDNPPSTQAFALLWDAIRSNPAVSCVGGWYRFFNEVSDKVFIAAGKQGSNWENITEEEIRASEHLIRVPFIGFGLCLMKWQVIQDIGVRRCFAPYYFPDADPEKDRLWATDDSGFFAQATEKGHKIFLHPAVFLQHQKQMNVPASFETRNELVPILKEI